MVEPDDDAPDLRESRTIEHLREGFGADCQDVSRYLYFANRAEVEGEIKIANLFRAASRAQQTRARVHLDLMREVSDPKTRAEFGDSEQNLRAALARAKYEGETMYVEFARVAREEGFDEVGDWFDGLAKAERQHARLFQQALGEVGGPSMRRRPPDPGDGAP